MSASTCIHCGAPLNRPGAKFCTTCGKAQPAAEPVAVAASAAASYRCADCVDLRAADRAGRHSIGISAGSSERL